MVQPDGEEKLLIAKAEDALRLAEKRFCVKTLGFLNPHQRVLIQNYVKKPAGMKLVFDGGFPEAERTQMVCYPEFFEPVREEYLALLECTGRELGGLSHRDYLGSLMGLGIVRENIGDILVGEGKTFFFLKPEIVDYVLQNLTKIGRQGIRLTECPISAAELPERPVKEIAGTVAALRLDAVLALGTGLARGKAAELIQGGQVAVNWVTVQEVSGAVKEADLISVRGFGRMKLLRIGGTTRKGRIGITIIRYV
ncbi:MAG: RNA-binding protein [Clostridia bacterium]|nr:RNA-binding protein [Clostridia bacterium]